MNSFTVPLIVGISALGVAVLLLFKDEDNNKYKPKGEEVVKRDNEVYVILSPTCGFCRKQQEVLDAMGDTSVNRVMYDKSNPLCKNIRAFPTWIKGNRREEGLKSEEEVNEFINS